MIAFLNGQFVPDARAVVPVNDRGFMYGDGLFETVPVINCQPFRLAQHLARLKQGADFLKIKSPYLPDELQDFSRRLIRKNKIRNALLRVTLTRGPGGRGYTPQTRGRPTVVTTLHSLPNRPKHWNLITSSYRVPIADPLASFKTLNKLVHIMARSEAVARGADEALLLNTQGEVAEAASGNVFWISRNRICTVPNGRGLLPGITRAVVLEICQKLGLPVHQCATKPEELRKAKGIFITQSAFGIVPVVAFDGRPVAASPVVARLRRAYDELLGKP